MTSYGFANTDVSDWRRPDPETRLLLAGLLARGAAPILAAAWSVYANAEAGQRLAARNGVVGFLAREIPGEIPGIREDLRESVGRSSVAE